MGTLSSELRTHAHRITGRPRVYVDANVPAGAVGYMRSRLDWDVLFVVEHDELRRHADTRHYQMARQLHRTLLTQDRDYLDDRQFPPEESGGVVVLAAPDERRLTRLLLRLDRELLRSPGRLEDSGHALPLSGRKLFVHVDWSGVEMP